jgi:glycosyltransferase involved in cell wall biosynthesis
VINGSGIDLKYYKYYGIAKNKFRNLRFLSLTRMQNVKGVYELLEATKIIKKKFPNVKIDIAGELERSFGGIPKKTINEWVLKKYIKYHGYKKDVRPLIKKSNVLILASYHEGLPRSVLEAMSVGRPVIVTNIPGNKLLVKNGKNGFKIPVKDSVSLANKMLWFINNKNQLNKMGKLSRKIVEKKFDVKKINKQLLRLLK